MKKWLTYLLMKNMGASQRSYGFSNVHLRDADRASRFLPMLERISGDSHKGKTIDNILRYTLSGTRVLQACKKTNETGSAKAKYGDQNYGDNAWQTKLDIIEN